MRLGLLPCLIIAGAQSGLAFAASSPNLVVNQAGYLASGPKTALLVNWKGSEAPSVNLIDELRGGVAMTLEAQSLGRDRDSGDTVHRIDFSAHRRVGRYRLVVKKISSSTFVISETPLSRLFRALLRSFYLQRCGVALEDPETGIAHAACHLADSTLARKDDVHPAGHRIASPGGWHDAGDYGKYVVTTAISVARLLDLYEAHPSIFYDGHLGIPESNNGIPDVLDEAGVAIDWMLSMQRKDGATYRKIGGAKWSSVVPPENDDQTRFVYGVSTSETAKFAAALALAARVYAPLDPAYSKTCLAAATKAWAYLEKQPSMMVDWKKSDDSGSGKYLRSEIDTEEALKHDVDDRAWAAAELFATTKEAKYRAYLIENAAKLPYTLFEWKDPAPMAMTRIAFDLAGELPPETIQSAREKILERAREAHARAAKSGYQLANDRFIWGSNKMVAEEGITLFHAYRLTKDRRYFEAAWEQLNFLVGKNHFGMSFVSGVGEKSVENLHHTFSRAKKLRLPGLLAGGPNDLAQSGRAPKNKKQLSYADDARSYATNEYAIDYNASLIGLVGLLIGDAR